MTHLLGQAGWEMAEETVEGRAVGENRFLLAWIFLGWGLGGGEVASEVSRRWIQEEEDDGDEEIGREEVPCDGMG